MIQVGIVGVGRIWERHRALLERLHRPIEVVAVYDSVHARAETVAESLDADVVTGLTTLSRRHDVHALLVFDPGAAGTAAIELLMQGRKPLFIAPWLPVPRDLCGKIYSQASQAGTTVMPTMPRRYLPSSMRLQELLATELGRPLDIQMTLTLPGSRMDHPAALEVLIGWLDYCRNLFRTPAESARLHEDTLEVVWPSIVRQYPTEQEGGSPPTEQPRRACLRLQFEQQQSDAPNSPGDRPTAIEHDPAVPVIGVICERGAARILSSTRIEWTTSPVTTESQARNSEYPQRETLTAERSESETMLDLFCRRVVGGLIPVADFRDIEQALQLLETRSL